MSNYARRATQIVNQLYNGNKAERVSAMIANANDDYAVTRILKDARDGKYDGKGVTI